MFLRRHKKLIIFLIMLTVTALGGIVGYFLAENEPRIAAHAAQEEEAVQAGTDIEKISADTVVVWDYEYEMCRHHVCLDTKPDADMIGMTFSKLKSAYPDISIVSFSAEKVVLKKKLCCYCPRHFLLKRNGGRLAVYKTAAGSDKQELYADTDIRFESLDMDLQTMLEHGRIFGSYEDVRKYLDEINH